MCLLSVSNRDPEIFSLREVLDLLAPHDGTGTGHKQDLVISEMLLSKPGHLFCPDMDSPGKRLGGHHSHPVGGLTGEATVSAFLEPPLRGPRLPIPAPFYLPWLYV